MALSDRWTQAQYLSACQRELMDSGARFWTAAELLQYIQDWVDAVQDKCGFVVGEYTYTLTATDTATLTDIGTDINWIKAVWVGDKQLTPQTVDGLNMIDYEWRDADETDEPNVFYQNDDTTVSVWPTIGTNTVTLSVEYVKELPIATSTDTIGLPPWCRYSCVPYVCSKAYWRPGPTNDPNRAMRYRAKFEKSLKRIQSIWAAHLPQRAPRLKPAQRFETDIVLGTLGPTIEV